MLRQNQQHVTDALCLLYLPYLSALKDSCASSCEQGAFSCFDWKTHRVFGSFCVNKLLDSNLFDDGIHDIA